jgi:hypothetical protein
MGNDRATLVTNIRKAASGGEQAAAVAALDAYDSSLRAEAQRERELGWAGELVSRTLGVGPMHGDRHTTDTDWLAEMGPGGGLDYRTAMAAEAGTWVRRLPREVLADRGEFTAQARGMGRTYGGEARHAYDTFLSAVARAYRSLAASGLPQIDQVTDPHDQPSPTPYPTEVFDNFAPEQNDYNGGVEGPAHDSEISSRSAPMLQQVEQMDGSGSGFGSGPERPDEHTTSFDTSNSYAEVPLGPEGTIPSAASGPGAAPPGHSSPAPVTNGAGPLDESDDEERRGAHITGSRYSRPDRLGYRWMIGPEPEAYHPFHEKCASSHWPDEGCTQGMPHVASVAIDHGMTIDQARHLGACESVGLREGLRALRASRGDFRVLAAHHNRLAAAWGATERSAEDTAVLRGFQAVVRPVLADFEPPQPKASKKASKKSGKRKNKAKGKPQKKKDPFDGAAPPFGQDRS